MALAFAESLQAMRRVAAEAAAVEAAEAAAAAKAAAPIDAGLPDELPVSKILWFAERAFPVEYGTATATRDSLTLGHDGGMLDDG